MSEHAAAKPAEEPKELSPGPFGQFLNELGIPTKRLPDSCGVETIEVAANQLEAAMKKLRNSPETQMDFLIFVAGVDSADTYDSVYQLWSYSDATKELIVKVRVPKTECPDGKLPQVPSITPMWQAANWHERETYDLVGIRYIGHPYLRRILNPWDWEGYPLRRDYKQLVDALNDKHPGSMR